MRKTQVVALIIGLLEMLLMQAHAVPPVYYVQNGDNVAAVYTGDPKSEANILGWEIRLYRAGETRGGPGHWGLISGTSAAEVMKELKECQDVEDRYEEAWHQTYASRNNGVTWRNSFGPIAIRRKPPAASARNNDPKLSSIFRRVRQVSQRIQPLSGTLGAAAEAVKQRPTDPANPFKDVGSVFREYVENLSDARTKLYRLQRALNDNIDILLPNFDAAFKEIESDLSSAEKNRSQLVSMSGSSADSADSADWKSSYWTQVVPSFPNRIIHQQRISTDSGVLSVTKDMSTQPDSAIKLSDIDVNRIEISPDGFNWKVGLHADPFSQLAQWPQLSSLELTYTNEAVARKAAKEVRRLAISAGARKR